MLMEAWALAGGPCLPWIFIYGSDKIERGLMVLLFFGLVFFRWHDALDWQFGIYPGFVTCKQFQIYCKFTNNCRYLKLLIYLSSYFDQKIVKGSFRRTSNQAATVATTNLQIYIDKGHKRTCWFSLRLCQTSSKEGEY